jgi:hypothetical protein
MILVKEFTTQIYKSSYPVFLFLDPDGFDFTIAPCDTIGHMPVSSLILTGKDPEKLLSDYRHNLINLINKCCKLNDKEYIMILECEAILVINKTPQIIDWLYFLISKLHYKNK